MGTRAVLHGNSTLPGKTFCLSADFGAITMQFKPKSFRLFLLTLLPALTLGFASLSLQAQTDTGRVSGVVEDATEANIPGAAVTITNTDTSATLTTTADGAGNFNFPALPRGNYKITASMNGFQTTTQNFQLQVSQTQIITFKLNAGGSNETR
jgi:hypothetical protein